MIQQVKCEIRTIPLSKNHDSFQLLSASRRNINATFPSTLFFKYWNGVIPVDDESQCLRLDRLLHAGVVRGQSSAPQNR